MTSSVLVFLVNPATRQLILAQNETDGERPLSHLAPVAFHCEEPAKPSKNAATASLLLDVSRKIHLETGLQVPSARWTLLTTKNKNLHPGPVVHAPSFHVHQAQTSSRYQVHCLDTLLLSPPTLLANSLRAYLDLLDQLYPKNAWPAISYQVRAQLSSSPVAPHSQWSPLPDEALHSLCSSSGVPLPILKAVLTSSVLPDSKTEQQLSYWLKAHAVPILDQTPSA